ncbi:MAG: GNAT family N-acetyltransferase [Egibacteraceae bacterium]
MITAGAHAVTGAAVEVRTATADEVLGLVGELSGVYEATFSEPPYFETAGHARRFANRLPRRTSAGGFRCALARAADDQRLVGFAFGMTADPLLDPPFYAELIDSVGLWAAARWLLDQFEFVELAVLPNWQRRGIGGLLHDEALEGVTHRAAWLLTHPLAPALGFYQTRGWRELGLYHTGHRKLVVMGLPLAKVGRRLPALT